MTTLDPALLAWLDGHPIGPTLRESIEQWLTGDRYAEDRSALELLVQNAAGGDDAAQRELLDAFDGPLPIGTGGRRGHVGPGTNRINAAVLRETAKGLVDAMAAEDAARKVAIAYDTRRDSRRFAHIVADQLAAGGLDVLLIDAPRPTPQLSFAVRTHGCGAGVVISASHNPPNDNGIKIYGPDGAQVLGVRDRTLMAAIRGASTAALDGDGPRGTITALEDPAGLASVDEPYHSYLLEQSALRGDLADSGLSVVFTPLHGVGHTSCVPLLRKRGLTVHTVDRQCDPDGGNFSTVESANPESPASMDMARALADEVGADLVVATDPDADRLGTLTRDASGRFVAIDGNRMAVLMLDHVLRHAPKPDRGWVLTTVVSSPLIGSLCRAHGVDVVEDLLVGFKHHAGMMAEQPDRPVLFACEESHGFLRGDEVHDKDGAIAALLLAEAAAAAKRGGVTLLDQLDRVWAEHGYHREKTANLYAYGAAGREAIAALMKAWRATPPTAFGGLKVISRSDRADPRSTGSPTRDLPGNVLAYDLEGEAGACRLVIRPSGTEPKAKVYALAHAAPGDPAGPSATAARIDGLVDAVLDDAEAQARAVMAPFLE